MPRFPLRSLALVILLLLPVAPLAQLCRGHTPSRFDKNNLPAWERHTPIAALRLSHAHRRLEGFHVSVKRKVRDVT
ncbi:MAG: hypothetical protein ACRYFS_01745 [Janthinobacterium lividum]